MSTRDGYFTCEQPLNSSPPLKLESVQLDRALGDTFLREECRYLEPLISLELDYLTKFVVVNKSAVASKFLAICQQGMIYSDKDDRPTFLKALRSFLGSYSICQSQGETRRE
jgi:hypothetical protein